MNYDAKCSSHLAYSHLLSTYCLLCPLTPFSCLRCIHALWWICFTEGFWGSSWESRFGLSQEKPGNLCLDSQSCPGDTDSGVLQTVLLEAVPWAVKTASLHLEHPQGRAVCCQFVVNHSVRHRRDARRTLVKVQWVPPCTFHITWFIFSSFTPHWAIRRLCIKYTSVTTHPQAWNIS